MTNYLDEFEPSVIKSDKVGWLISCLDLLFVLYVSGLLVYRHVYLSIPLQDDILLYALVFLASPLIIWFLFIKGYKIGWVLRILYYSLFVSILGFGIINQKVNTQHRLYVIGFIVLSGVVLVSCFYPGILKKLNIGWKLILLSIILSLLLFLLLYMA